jgi:alpha-beta hydrolase superfamily lysophospholipase
MQDSGPKIYIVAHSMGGLVSRSALLDEAQSKAVSIRGIPKSHAGALSDDRTVAILYRLFRDKLKD